MCTQSHEQSHRGPSFWVRTGRLPGARKIWGSLVCHSTDYNWMSCSGNIQHPGGSAGSGSHTEQAGAAVSVKEGEGAGECVGAENTCL